MLRQVQRRLASSLLVPGLRLQRSQGCLGSFKEQTEKLQARWQSTETGTQIDREAAENNYCARVDLAAAYRGLNYYDLGEGVCNHLTARAPARNGQGDVLLLVSYGIHWCEVTASSLVGVDFQTGELVEGEGKIEMSAINIHRAIHNARFEDGVTCVMHNHQPYTTALACIKGGRLKNVHQNSMYFHNKIAYDVGYGGIPVGKECEHMVKHLGKKEVLFMGNHGVVVVGNSIAAVFDSLYYLEKAAKFQVLAMSTGKELWECSDEVAEEVGNFDRTDYNVAHFEAIKRLIAKDEPNFRS